jgi:hypothetical protein
MEEKAKTYYMKWNLKDQNEIKNLALRNFVFDCKVFLKV